MRNKGAGLLSCLYFCIAIQMEVIQQMHGNISTESGIILTEMAIW